MATYKKRGYKPKTKAEEHDLETENSTTAEVFTTLDESASRSEQWVAKNQNYILGVIGVVAIAVLGYLAYNQFVMVPKNSTASNELFYPQQYFEQAMQAEGAAKDSLYTMALEGAEGKYGFLDIIDEYAGTPAANLATYSAGMSYLHLNQYQDAINYLEDFDTDEAITGALALGAIGDAFMQLEQPEEALDYYKKAIGHDTNEFTTPLYLYKAGVTALEIGEQSVAADFFTRIKEEFPDAKEAASVDVFLGMANRNN